MNRAEQSRIAHGELALLNPLGEERLDEVIEQLELPAGARVVEVGCGKGELLVKLARRHDVHALGVDISAEYIEEALRHAPAGVRFEQRDMNELDLPEQSFHLAVSHAAGWGDVRVTLEQLKRLVKPGGQLLLGEGYWRAEPSEQYLAALGAGRDELRSYGGMLELGEELGLVSLYVVTASEQDWERYEWTLIRNAERAGLSDYAHGNRDRYARLGGREMLGFGLWLFARS